ncbi:MAG: hypothetical protein IPG66_13015 [Hydrogenophilales bacterium]|nr:hypothetical protein [Hydrogenophilales bacterium]
MTRGQWLAPVAIIFLIAGVVLLNHTYKQHDGAEVVLQCADLRAGCRAMLGDREVTVGVNGELKLLKPFEVWVRVEGVQKLQASFTMKGMDMGFNLYTLRPDGKGAYQARITLPICVTGRHDWLLHLDLDEQRLTVPFVTEL